MNEENSAVLKLGISSCLLGELVRYDGGHAKARHVAALGEYVDWVPVCPEMEIGMGTPRPTIRLEKHDEIRLIEPAAGTDYTDAMNGFAKQWLAENDNLHGMIVKSGSPSCGPAVKVYHDGLPGSNSPGLFTAAIPDRMPVIDEGHFYAPDLRDHFLERCVARRSWLEKDNLHDFHARHKMQLMAHDPVGYRRLGQIVAAKGDGYEELFFATMAVPATRGKHLNTMQHLFGFIKNQLSAPDKKRIQGTLESYVQGHVPLVVPLTLLQFLLESHDAPEWARKQSYLEPYPGEWMVRANV